MSRSALRCRRCGRLLGHRHHSKKLHVATDVTVHFILGDSENAFARLICPQCGCPRTYWEETIIVRPDSQQPQMK